MDCEIDNKSYKLTLDYNKSESRIVLIPYLAEDTLILIMDLPYIINKINPNNIVNKLKTIMTFS
jgi:hypothetical protein